MSAHCLVLSCLYIVTRTRTVAQVMSLSHHPHVHVHVSVFSSPCSPFLLHALPAARNNGNVDNLAQELHLCNLHDLLHNLN